MCECAAPMASVLSLPLSSRLLCTHFVRIIVAAAIRFKGGCILRRLSYLFFHIDFQLSDTVLCRSSSHFETSTVRTHTQTHIIPKALQFDSDSLFALCVTRKSCNLLLIKSKAFILIIIFSFADLLCVTYFVVAAFRFHCENVLRSLIFGSCALLLFHKWNSMC